MKCNNVNVSSEFFVCKKSCNWRDWLTAGMSYTMVPVILHINKYIFVCHLFLKFLSLFMLICLLLGRTGKKKKTLGVPMLLRAPQFDK